MFRPKHHIVFHLMAKIPLLGNHQLYATWLDEALNKVLKTSCRNASQAVFERTVLLRMRELLRQWTKQKPGDEEEADEEEEAEEDLISALGEVLARRGNHGSTRWECPPQAGPFVVIRLRMA